MNKKIWISVYANCGSVGPNHSKSRIRTAFSPPRASVQRTHTTSSGRHYPVAPLSNSGIRARSTSPSVTNYNPVVSQRPPHPLPLHSPVDSRYKSFLTNASTPTRELVGLSEAFDTQPRVNTPIGFIGSGPHRGGITRVERGPSVLSDSSKSPSDRIVQHPTLRHSPADDSEFAVLGFEISSIHHRREAQSKSAGMNNADVPHVSWNGLSHTPQEALETDSGRARSSFAPKVPLHQSNVVGTEKPAPNGTLRTSDADVSVSRLPVAKPLGQSPTSDSRVGQCRYSQNGVTPALCSLARLTNPLEVDVSLTDTKPVARSQMQKFIPRVMSRGDDTKVGREIAGVSPVTVHSEQAAPLQEIEKHEDMKALQLAPRSSLESTENEHLGLQNVDSSQRGGLAKRGYSSTQFLARNNSNSDLVKPMPMHQSQTMISPSPQPLQASRFNTSATLVNHSQATVLLNGSRGHLSPTNSTAAPTTTTPVITNGWKVDGSVKQPFIDRGQDNGNLGIVQDTAPSWYRPKLSREAAINILRQQPPGNFLIRDSTTFKGAYGLAVKVATLPPKVTQKSGFTKFVRSLLNDLQSELVRHYLIEVVNTPTRGVRLKGFASEPVFPSLAALIHQHTIDPLALPCRLILPPVPTNLPSSGSATLPPLVIGTVKHASAVEDGAMPDNVTVASSGSVRGAPSSEVGSLHTDGPVGPPHRMDGIAQMPIQVHDNPVPSHNVPYVCVVREGSSPQRRSPLDITGNQGLTFRCLMLGSVDTPQWSSELCFARAVDQLIPLTLLTASECDHGVSRVRYTEVQLHVSAHDGITIIDLQRRLFLRRHLPNHVLLYCGLESRKKEFSHPEHQIQGLIHPRIFGIVVRKGISECTTHVFSELDRAHTADYVVQHIRATYPHMNVR
ncbi:Tensin-1, variant 2 [Clonorchis sinensis]|uniref:Tensin-1, variant 2 n=1 Tax=Clonorchis sinensis TaxID=79923 RepID=A0A8T1MXE0_CLOSI|nr:Tensin-1, variant 2 [Clonorchis sinensis]